MEIAVLASGSSGNCYRVSDGHTSLLLECGIPFKEIQKKLNFQLHEIDACLVSHEHQDHAKAVKELLKYGIEVCMSTGTATMFDCDLLKITTVEPLQQFKVGTFEILPFSTEHDTAEPIGFLIYSTVIKEKLLFVTDTYYVRYRFSGLNYIMVECNYSMDILNKNVEAGLVESALKSRILKSHFSLENVKEFLKANDLSRVREIWLLHLSDGNSDEKRFKREVMELTGKPTYIA